MPDGFAWLYCLVIRYFNPPRRDAETGDVGLAARQSVLLSLQASASIRDTGAAERVLDATLKVTDTLRDSVNRIEGKSTSIIVLCTALLGFTMSFLTSAKAVVVPLVWTECALLVGAIVTSALALLVRPVPMPSPVLYNLAATLNDPANEGKILMQLIESWQIYNVSERLLGLRKSRAFNLSFVTTLMALCVLAVMVGATAASTARASGNTAGLVSVHSSGAAGPEGRAAGRRSGQRPNESRASSTLGPIHAKIGS